jgi:hypothetical protein
MALDKISHDVEKHGFRILKPFSPCRPGLAPMLQRLLWASPQAGKESASRASEESHLSSTSPTLSGPPSPASARFDTNRNRKTLKPNTKQDIHEERLQAYKKYKGYKILEHSLVPRAVQHQ